MSWLFALLCAILLAQLVYPALLITLARLRSLPQRPTAPAASVKFACIITAYRNAAIAQPLVQSLLQQSCPDVQVYLVADECPVFDFGITDPRYHPLIPESPLRLKVRSIRYAMSQLVEQPDYVVVFDADNLAHPKFLAQLKPWISAGFSCVQGQRTAKNLDTVYAALDSLGEHYKNFLERETAFRLGSSAVISGSGMATRYDLYRAYLESEAIAQGHLLGKKMLQEDKILQNFLLSQDIRIAYAREALVYDEKVSKGKDVETQRGRWLYSYFQNIPNALTLLGLGVRNRSFNQLYFGAITLVLPMFIQIGLAGLCLLAGLFLAPWWSLLLLLGLLVFMWNIWRVLQLDQAPEAVKRAVWLAPVFILRQIRALGNMRDPNRNFQPTENRQARTVDEVLREREE
ncbi:MAG TPA: glycosyltransferase [Saprospiraceae bacterium]|nr:glycosyltransferase [Saprospiraceae bacterium]